MFRWLRNKIGEGSRFYSLHAYVVLSVFMLMVWSGFLTGAVMLIFHKFFGNISILRTPAMLIISSIIVSCIIGSFLSLMGTRFLVKPVEKVIKAMKRVEKGDFSVRVDENECAGEISELVKSYNKMAQELGGIEMFRENFINSFSHEFKTPIVSIEGFAKQLRKDNLSEEKKRQYVDIIISESKRLTNLSSNILMLSKLENQQIVTDKTQISLDEQIRSCILLLEKQWSAKNIEFDIDMDSIHYVTNAEMLSQAWVNIIGNAIKFSPEDSVISISLKMSEGKIKAVVSDKGIGMKEETIHHIFERFYQGDKAHSAEGSGLGLPLVKRIIELNDGDIRVESQYGAGTKFIVQLPDNAADISE